jgi:REP element-mobilizing transposase RayT
MAIENSANSFRGVYFCTITNYKWLPLIDVTNAYDHIYDVFKMWKSQNVHIVSYVIMPNHIHLIVYIENEDISLMKLIANFKRFLAYEIVKRLKVMGEDKLLAKLRAGVKESAKSKHHQVFEYSFDVKACYSKGFLAQKLNYIHANPVSKKWKLVDDYRLYPHSSAGFYELGIIGLVEIFSYLDL